MGVIVGCVLASHDGVRSTRPSIYPCHIERPGEHNVKHNDNKESRLAISDVFLALA
jgi:hypothetical protein